MDATWSDACPRLRALRPGGASVLPVSESIQPLIDRPQLFRLISWLGERLGLVRACCSRCHSIYGAHGGAAAAAHGITALSAS